MTIYRPTTGREGVYNSKQKLCIAFLLPTAYHWKVHSCIVRGLIFFSYVSGYTCLTRHLSWGKVGRRKSGEKEKWNWYLPALRLRVLIKEKAPLERKQTCIILYHFQSRRALPLSYGKSLRLLVGSFIAKQGSIHWAW